MNEVNQEDLSRAAKEFFSDRVKLGFKDCDSDGDYQLPNRDRIEMTAEYAGWTRTIIIEKKFLPYDINGRYLESRFELLAQGLGRLIFTNNNK